MIIPPRTSHHIIAGWWFGCHQFYFPRNIGCLSSSQLTNSIIFQDGVFPQPPTSNFCLSEKMLWFPIALQDHPFVVSLMELSQVMDMKKPKRLESQTSSSLREDFGDGKIRGCYIFDILWFMELKKGHLWKYVVIWYVLIGKMELQKYWKFRDFI